MGADCKLQLVKSKQIYFLQEFRIYRKMKKSENKPIFIDVKFEETLSKENCSLIMLELIKNLIYQRRQIPLTFDTLKRETQKYYAILANEYESSENNEMTELDMKPRDRLRLKK